MRADILLASSPQCPLPLLTLFLPPAFASLLRRLASPPFNLNLASFLPPRCLFSHPIISPFYLLLFSSLFCCCRFFFLSASLLCHISTVLSLFHSCELCRTFPPSLPPPPLSSFAFSRCLTSPSPISPLFPASFAGSRRHPFLSISAV